MDDIMLKKEILDYIKDLRKSTPEEIRMICLSCYKIAILSSITFGLNNNMFKDSLSIIKEFVDICNLESKIFDFIIENLDYYDLESTIKYLEDLDYLNEMTYLYYDGVIADIEEAIYYKKKNCVKRRYKNFNTLLDSDYYYERIDSLRKK